MKMIDHVNANKRSLIMAAVSRENTKPEKILRKALHRLGYRFRLHRKDLPGTPDIVFPSKHAAIFVHGCYWHGHNCRWGRLPKSNVVYWRHKIETNKARDNRQIKELEALGWRVKVVWQCELRNLSGTVDEVTDFLESR